ncbi:DNA double-strand break repair nuclease NurA [Halocatena marina]|uniref:DNA double-strand break repair nuclease NurA n=1 Tax=Halocatena marina TaxID=2934937 RepID=A0ABD5YQF6_9EURY|nr:DNA double-strand break repair nuclease NurA [Halocatena marina]
MTLDPVHFKGITQLAGRIKRNVDASDHRDFAATVWNEWLDPLRNDGEIVVEPVDEQHRRMVTIEDIALSDDQFPTRHGVDSGTINPTTFKNGLVLDVAQAAMSAVPSDLELHRSRTVVMTVHSNDATVDFHDDWQMRDEGYTRERVLHAPRVSRYESAVVHELALYLAESEHACTQAEVVEDLLILDGPIYPKGLLNWSYREPELADLLVENERPRDVVENYIELVENFAKRDVPLVGFVKTPLSRSITRTVRQARGNAPWVNDAAFFSQVLGRSEQSEDSDGSDRNRDTLTFTNWFVSRGGSDRAISTLDDAFDLERELSPEEYEVTFCVMHDPRDDVIYRIEAPAVFTHDADRREKIITQVLKGVAIERGPPLAIEKADSLARISKHETQALQDSLAETLDSERDMNYDTKRSEQWGLD